MAQCGERARGFFGKVSAPGESLPPGSWTPAAHAGPMGMSSLWSPSAMASSWEQPSMGMVLGWLIPVANMGSLMGDCPVPQSASQCTWAQPSPGKSCHREEAAPRCSVESAEVAAALEELEGTVRQAALSSQGHLSLLKVVELLSPMDLGAVSNELLGAGVETAKSVSGSRVLCALLAKCPESALVTELLGQALYLSKDANGHQVVASLLEHGSERQRAAIVGQLAGDLVKHARNRSMSHVIEKALSCCGPELRQAMTAELTAQESDVLQLAQNRFGRFVVKKLVQLDPRVQNLVQFHSRQLRSNKYGARFLSELARHDAPKRRPRAETVNLERLEPEHEIEPARSRLLSSPTPQSRRWADESDED